GCTVVAKIMAGRRASTDMLSHSENKKIVVKPGASVCNGLYITQSNSNSVDLEMENFQREDAEKYDDDRNRTDNSAVEEGMRTKRRVSPCRRHWIRDRTLNFYSKYEPTIKLSGMIIVGLGYSILAEYLGSSRLLGAFVAGVFFSAFKDLCHQYEQQIAYRVQPMMSAVFFATIGFAIPLTKMLEPVLFGWGVVYAVIAVLSKITTMIAVPARISSLGEKGPEGGVSDCQFNARWVVGAAMIARGELGLLMAQQAQMQGVMGQAAMVITTWSIVLATLFGVGALGVAVKRKF
ncbi:Hsp70 ATPase ssc1, partial [Lunasporangiospora selenospora]